jgi:hypothetical protein
MPRQLPPLDDDVFEALQALAEPLIDDINSVLRRVLKLNGARPPHASGATPGEEPAPGVTETVTRRVLKPSRRRSSARRRGRATAPPKPKRPRAPRGSILPESEYELPILEFLDRAGGRAPASEVVEAVGAKLAERFTPGDLEPVSSGDVRWKSRIQFVRLRLIREGAMAKDAPRGVWELTDEGRTRLNGSAS